NKHTNKFDTLGKFSLLIQKNSNLDSHVITLKQKFNNKQSGYLIKRIKTQNFFLSKNGQNFITNKGGKKERTFERNKPPPNLHSTKKFYSQPVTTTTQHNTDPIL
ncbi:hypothetical protein TorRG33x02_008720, partial [Trema orientale]